MTQYIYKVNHKSGTISFGPEMYIENKLKTNKKRKQTAGVFLVDTYCKYKGEEKQSKKYSTYP